MNICIYKFMDSIFIFFFVKCVFDHQGAGQEQDQGLGASESVYFTLAVALGRYQMPRALLQVT